MTEPILRALLHSEEPSIRFKVLVNVLNRDRESDEIKGLQEEIRHSPRVQTLLSLRNEAGQIPFHPYTKWYGAHWVLADLDGQIISADFVQLHYPCYWHYDILFGLKVMAEAGFIGDERCHEALDLLASKRLPDGGFPAEAKYYQATGKLQTGHSLVDWGGTSRPRLNEFVTVDALFVLRASGRLIAWENQVV